MANGSGQSISAAALVGELCTAGLGAADVADWAASEPRGTPDYNADCKSHSRFWARSAELVGRLPPKSKRDTAENNAAGAINQCARAQREKFLATHCETLYELLTSARSRFMRVENLVIEAASAVPGLTPTRDELAEESKRLQRDKDGVEIDQGILLAHVLASPRAGEHLCHAMLLPRTECVELLPRLACAGVVDLGPVRVERRGKASFVTASNPRFLNAEDQTTLDAMEIAVDLAVLDPATEIAVLRGGVLDHPKYRGRRVFGAGINLTQLYRGQIPFVWFLQRDMGFVHKFMRGVARPDAVPDDVHGHGSEKLWIAALDGFAIGGHCQILLTMDYVLAARDAFMTLPARKEGIIPGLANLRLPRFTGDRIARQAIQAERILKCDSPEGRLICDEIADAADMDAALARLVERLTGAGTVSAVGNRRALRIGAEPLDTFRRYCSAYARDQAFCYVSPALIANLERNWDAHNRKV